MTDRLTLYRLHQSDFGDRGWACHGWALEATPVPARSSLRWTRDERDAVCYAAEGPWAGARRDHPNAALEVAQAISVEASTPEVLHALRDVRPDDAPLLAVFADRASELTGSRPPRDVKPPVRKRSPQSHAAGEPCTVYRYRRPDGQWATRAPLFRDPIDKRLPFSTDPTAAAYTFRTSGWGLLSQAFPGGHLEAYKLLNAHRPLPDVLRGWGRDRTDQALFEAFADLAERLGVGVQGRRERPRRRG